MPSVPWGHAAVAAVAALGAAAAAAVARRGKPGGAARLSFRQARPTDSGQLMSLIRQLAEDEGAEGGSAVVRVTDTQLAAGLGRGECEAVLADSGGRVVGFALYSWGWSSWEGGTLALDDLFVCRGHRGRGIGSALLGELMRRALDRGAGRIAWMSLRTNQPANRFYEATVRASRRDEVHCWLLDRPGMQRFVAQTS